MKKLINYFKIFDEKTSTFDKVCQLLTFLAVFIFEIIALYELLKYKNTNFLETSIDIFILFAPIYSIVFSINLYNNIKFINSLSFMSDDLNIIDIKKQLSLINEMYSKKKPFYYNIFISTALLIYSAFIYLSQGSLSKYELFIDIIVFISLAYMTFQARAHKQFSRLARFLLKNSEIA